MNVIEARKVVDAMVEAEESFTAFDVTTQLRVKGEFVLHYEVRALVHGLFDNDDPIFTNYSRENHVIGHGTNVLVFHPYNVDVDEYDPNKFVNATSKQTILDQTTDIDDDQDEDEDDDKIGTDKRGRLCVRASFIRQLGLNAGDKVVIGKDADSLIVQRFVPSYADEHVLKVDKDNCVRVGPKTLKKVFNQDANTLRVEIEFSSDSAGRFVKVTA